MPCRFSDRWPASQTQASWASWLCVDRLPLVNYWTKKPLYTAVSRKVVLRTGKTLRDNLESYHGQWWFLRLLLNLKVFQHGGRKQHKHMYSFFLVPCCWITLNLNQAKLLLPLMPIDIVEYAFTGFCETTFGETAVFLEKYQGGGLKVKSFFVKERELLSSVLPML